MKPHKKAVHAVRSHTPGIPAVPITPGLTRDERKAMWVARMPWPENYARTGVRSRQTPLGEVAALWI